MNRTITDMMTRRSIKKFRPDPVPRELIDYIVTCGTHAPSGMNKQSPIILAVTDRKVRNKLAKLNAKVMGCDSDPFYGAPVVLVVLADKSVPTYIYDGSLVMGNLLLAAYSFGLGSCWIHRAKEVFETKEGQAILKKLGITGDYEGIGNCVIGLPELPLPEKKPRKENYVYYV